MKAENYETNLNYNNELLNHRMSQQVLITERVSIPTAWIRYNYRSM